jgi:TonB family protein
VVSETAPTPSVPKPKWKPSRPSQTVDPNPTSDDEDFESPAPILTKPAKIASSSSSTSSSTSSASKKAVRLGPDQIGSPSAKPTPAGNRGQGGKSSYSNPAHSGGGKGLAGVDALADFDFAPYMAGVTQRLRRNWTPPSEDATLKTVAVFTVSRNGNVSNLRILRSSGSSMHDAAALSAIRASSPFRSFPPDADKQAIQIEFSFDYSGVRG